MAKRLAFTFAIAFFCSLVLVMMSPATMADEFIPLGKAKDPTATHATQGHSGMTIVNVSDAKKLLEIIQPRMVRNLRGNRGAFVLSVMPGSAAESSGLLFGDVITQVNNVAIQDGSQVIEIIAGTEPGSTVAVKATRAIQQGSRVIWKTISGEVKVLSYLENCRNACELSKDVIGGIASAKHKNTPSSPGRTFVALKINQSNDATVLSIVFNYSAKDWIFLRKGTLTNGGEKIELTFSGVLRDNGSGVVWEVATHRLSGNEIDTLRKLLKSESKIVARFTGNDYYRDIDVEDSYISDMRVVFDLYAMNVGAEITHWQPALEAKEVAAAKVPAEFRVFSDVTGQFKIEATFVSADENIVVLLKQDGDEIKIPVGKLSDDDRKWIAEQTEMNSLTRRFLD
jgi:hypothetical protein